MKNKVLFYLLSVTWGSLMTFIGLLSAVVLLCAGYKPKKWGGCWYFNVGKHWGGLNLGIIFLVDESSSDYTKNHEFGHAIQNCFLGPFMLFVIGIPSAVRYWYREIRLHKGLTNTTYDAIWFERSATKLGNNFIGKW
jgi:hypothetical protein